MHIVSAADDAFVPHFCAMLHSAWLFHPGASYTLLAHEVSEDTLTLLREFAAKRRIKLDIVEIGKRLTDGLPVGPGFTAATYSRLFLAELLPASLERVIYLDADITLNGKLDDLFSMDMQGMPLAAAPDSEGARAIERGIRDLPDDFSYFNTGVLLVDLAAWRRENIGKQIVSFSMTTTAPLVFMDQSSINVVLQRRILSLDRALNVSAIEFFEGIADPIVIHYAGWKKPWRAAWSAFHELYCFHRSHTPWPLHEVSATRRRLKDWRRRLAAWLGLPRYRQMAEEMHAHREVRQTVARPALERARGLLARAEIAG